MINPRSLKSRLSALGLTMAITLPVPLWAGPGHDHGTEVATASVAAPTSPRFEAVSERFVVVGRLVGENLRLWVDDWATNTPIEGASVNLTIGPRKALAKADVDGTYVLPFPEHDTPGTYPVTISLRGAGEPALLGASLIIDDSAVHAHAEEGLPLGLMFGGAALLLGVAGGALFLVRRKRAGLALVAFGLLAGGWTLATGTPSEVVAGPGHGDEGHAELAGGVPDNRAMRLADGDIVAPKPMQHLIGLRTILAGNSAEGSALQLNGVVIADPNGSGVVQASSVGRVSGQLPALGQRVVKGQVLALVSPALDADVSLITARGAAETALAEAELAAGPSGFAAEAAELAQARSRLDRLTRLEGVVPNREIAGARTAVDAAAARLNLAKAQAAARLRTARTEASRLRQAGSNAEVLRAPVSGVISAVSVAQGQVINPGQTVFTITNPDQLLVEARAPSGKSVPLAATGSARTSDGRNLLLIRQGEGLAMVDGAAPLRFKIDGPSSMRVGEPVMVFITGSEQTAGVALPRDAVVKGMNGQTMVFLKQAAEQFQPTPVTITDLDANRVIATSGIKAGTRVATTGAALLEQVR
ncbi:MAG: efflux RND transporter periplasmic adaptor subunit [Hyphomonadaceae bacterium]